MSEVIMCARSEDVNQVSNTTQKRPLSIITEQDCDDPEVTNHRRHQQHRQSGTGNNTSPYKDTPVSSKEENNVSVQLKVSKSKRNHKVSKGQKKGSSKAPPSSPKSQPSVNKQHTFTSKSKASHTNPTSTSHLSHSQIEVSSQFNSVHSSSDKGNNKCEEIIASAQEADIMVPSCEGKDNKCDVNLVPRAQITAPSNLTNLENPHSVHQQCPETHCLSCKTNQSSWTSSSDDLQEKNMSPAQYSMGNQDMIMIREDTDQLISPLSSSSSKQSLEDRNPTVDRRLLMQASRSPYEINDSFARHIPHITITSTEGTDHLDYPTLCSALDTVNTTNNNSRLPKTIISSTFTTDISNGKLPMDFSSSNKLNQSLTSRTCFLSKRHKLTALPKTKTADSTQSFQEGELNDSGSRILKDPENATLAYLSDFWKLKETTEKLRLSTRRPSTMLWKQQYIEGQGFPSVWACLNGEATEERLTTDRKKRINETLGWLRNELQEMRSEDQNLARQLLTIRHEIHQLKLQRCTEEHQELIEDFQSELDDIQEFSDVLDLPQPVYGNNPLKHIGVTRLNISARRFSAC